MHPVGIFLAETLLAEAGGGELGTVWPERGAFWLDADVLHSVVWHVVKRAGARDRWLLALCRDVVAMAPASARSWTLQECGHAAGHGHLVLEGAARAARAFERCEAMPITQLASSASWERLELDARTTAE